MHFSLIELWPAMTPLAKAVMILLATMSLVSLAVAAERLLTLGRAQRQSARFLAEWRPRLADEGVAAAAATTARYPRSHVAHLVGQLAHILTGREELTTRLEVHDRTARRVILAAGVDARQGLGVLATIGSTAPFVGLFGTVIGIVSSFQAMAATGQGGLGSVSAGIAEALVATALGIGVAIPALWLYNLLTQRIQRMLAEVECVAEELAVAALHDARPPRE